MEIKVTNSKLEDSFYLESEDVSSLRGAALKEIGKRGWDDEDCFSEVV